uniref:Chitin-binding type-2 domain-containing protein n=1 Tax=Anopheles atroparvus TaxID=41427 RepID=A0AAG5DIN3_ANOAO
MLRLAAVLFFVACANVQGQSTVCVGQPQHHFVAHETDCWRYYTCVDGQAILHECPESSIFIDAIQKCHFGDRSACVSCPVSGVKNFPVSGSCTKFIQCINGSQVQRECPAGTQFDMTVEQCNVATAVENSACSDIDIPITPPSLNPLSGCIGNVGVNNVPHPTDCTLFYLCIDQMQFLQQCGPNLVFDLNTLQCNRPELSVCVENIATPPTAGPGR